MNGKPGSLPLNNGGSTRVASENRLGGAARATIVNRTRRVVREQALGMQRQRQKTRSLWVPVTICSSLLLVICYAIWAVLDGYDLTPNGVPDASDQMALLLIWGLPVTIVVLGLAWLRRGRGRLGTLGELGDLRSEARQ